MIPTSIRDSMQAAAQSGVGAAISQAAARTGVDFSYLLGQARIESGFDPNARARTSSATGLFQFIEQTWLATVQQHGDKHGLGWAADAIKPGSNGRYYVSDPTTRRAILDMRKDPQAASTMAAEFAADNQNYLENKLGRPMESVDLYLAHFLGAGGAAKFLSAHDANPDAPAAGMLPAAARANRSIFYEKNGAPRSFAEIRERFAAKLGGSTPLPAPAQRSVPDVHYAVLHNAPAKVAGPTPQYARLAYLMLAQLGG
jgi:hypothetical protein